jgi:hypothetical protein
MLLAGGMVAGAAPLIAAPDAGATVKVSKTAVRFGVASRDGRTCGSCKLFLPPSACAFVEGTVDPNATCWIWRGKSA